MDTKLMNVNAARYALEQNEELARIINATTQPMEVAQYKQELQDRAIAAALRYLAQMNNVDSARISGSFRVVRVETDESETTHVRLEQVVNGVRVYGQELVAHVDSLGHVHSVTGNFLEELVSDHLQVRPAISTEAAIKRANHNFAGTISSPSIELLLYPTDQGVRLAYKVEFFDATQRLQYFIDARNGRLLDKVNLTPSAFYKLIDLPSAFRQKEHRV